jgi:hypothetical protein
MHERFTVAMNAIIKANITLYHSGEEGEAKEELDIFGHKKVV